MALPFTRRQLFQPEVWFNSFSLNSISARLPGEFYFCHFSFSESITSNCFLKKTNFTEMYRYKIKNITIYPLPAPPNPIVIINYFLYTSGRGYIHICTCMLFKNIQMIPHSISSFHFFLCENITYFFPLLIIYLGYVFYYIVEIPFFVCVV